MRFTFDRILPLQSLVMPALCGAWLVTASVLAQSDNRPPGDGHGPGGEGRGHKPPEAAYTACKDLNADDVCSVTFKEHTIEGTCTEDSETSKLFCRPDHPPGPPPGSR